MAKQWDVVPAAPSDFFERFPEVSPVVAQLLFNRGLDTQEKIDEFLNPDYEQDLHDPFLFRQMQPAVERIFAAVTAGQKIVVHGDYDADGVSSSAVMVSTLCELVAQFGPNGAEPDQLVDIFIPHREKEGYGLRPATVELFAEQGINLIVTVDCGIASKEEVDLANQKGIDVIVTDHHQELMELPKAVAVINPVVADDTYPFSGLAGVGVAFKVAQALLSEAAKRQPDHHWEAFEKWLLDLVALGTVADIMPLLGENRTLVKYGLVVLNKTRRIGLRALFYKAEIGGKQQAHNGNRDKLPDIGLNTYSIAYQIGPRLNAAGRMDHANTAYQLLITEDAAEAEQLSDDIQQNNAARRELTDKIISLVSQQLREQQDEDVLIAAGEDWPTGVLGLVASRAMDRFSKPVIVASLFEGKIVASGRSLPYFDIAAPLAEVDQYLERYGGHQAACGFALKDPSQFAEFVEAFRAKAAVAISAASQEEVTPSISIEAKVTLEELSWKLSDALDDFEPFGQANERPLFLVEAATVVEVAAIGKDQRHLRLQVQQQGGLIRKVIAFSFAERFKDLEPGDELDMVVELGINEWNGNRELQLKVVDMRRSGSAGELEYEPV